VHSPAYTSQEIAHSVHVPGREMVKSVILKADEGPLVMAVTVGERHGKFGPSPRRNRLPAFAPGRGI